MEEKDTRFEEIENVEDIEETEEETPRRSGISTFGAMAIGSGLTLGGIALFKKLKKAIVEMRAAKDADAVNDEVIIEAEVVAEPDPQSETEAKHPKK